MKKSKEQEQELKAECVYAAQKELLGTYLASLGFDPRTAGLWAQHANHCATMLLILDSLVSLRMISNYYTEMIYFA